MAGEPLRRLEWALYTDLGLELVQLTPNLD
jgi:hypothetical protein